MPLCGGTSDVKEATDEVQTLIEKVKEQVEAKLGRGMPEYTAKKFKTQVVAGTNFFVKVGIGSEEFLHLRIYRDLKQDVFLHGVQHGKTEEEDIAYFQE